MLSPTLKRVQLARSTLLLDQPFFGVLSLGLECIEDSTCKTAWTNGSQMGWSPAFVATLNNDQLMAVVAHEVMHCAAGHPWRREARDAERWNIAADYAINGLLHEAQFQLPASALLDAQYSGKWAEWIYDRLPQSPQSNSGSGQQPGAAGQSGNDPSGLGEVRDAPTGADAPTQAEWAQAMQQALRAAAQGTLPASLRRQLQNAVKPRVDWRSLLRRYVQDTARADYTWTLPNVRYIPLGLYLPRLHSHACGRFAIAVDTSGSIDDVLLQQFAAEVSAIVGDMQPSSVDVLYCDARIHRIDTFERGDSITIDAVGGGGTSFRPVFRQLADDPPQVLIYLTDLQGTFPSSAPEFPVIWAAYGSVDVAPFGDVVPCE